MTVVVGQYEEQPKKNPGGRPRGSTGNGKTLKEIKDRQERNLARIEFETVTNEARAEAENAQRIAELRAESRARVAEAYIAQEKARAPQFQIDQKPVLWILIGLAAITFVATAFLTADGTIGASAAARFATDWMGFIVFGVFEIATLAFMLMYYMRGSRIDIVTGERVQAVQWFVAMVLASVVTVGLSAYHVLDLYGYDITSIDLWVGIGIRVIASFFFVLVAKGIAGTLFAKAVQL